MNSIGHNFRVTIWGESHGENIGVCLDGVAAGIALDAESFSYDLQRRRNGALGTTPRSEDDTPHITSGIYNGRTTGAPIAIVFKNQNRASSDYTELAHHFRPSHSDMNANYKHNGFNDPRGGGAFSGRLTVGITAAGVVAKKILNNYSFNTQIIKIGGCDNATQFEEVILSAMADDDSVGGVVECRVEGVERGIGEPLFNSVESVISHLLFSIPAVKGVEFGAGFNVADTRGSQNNDLIIDKNGTTSTNHSGGIDGGICSGNELIVRVAIKPTPSIAKEQNTYDAKSDSIKPLSIRGRHDACIALRAAVVIEAAVAIALADLSMNK